VTDRSPDRLVWIDCEMTGLDLSHDELVEIACVVTDGQLTVLDEGVSAVIRPSDESVATMPDIVREMHTVSGLLADIPAGIPLADAEALVLEYVQRHVPEARKAPLAGSSIYVDRGFLARDMKALDEHLHYRVVDVSSIKELVRRWYPRVFFASPKKNGGHRALGDILDSISELRFYREAVFVEPPGPDTAAARELATLHTRTPDPEAPAAP
jgi:oligoribonuclease